MAGILSGLRDVAMTRSPWRKAIRTSSRPRPEDVPVMSHVRDCEDMVGAEDETL